MLLFFLYIFDEQFNLWTNIFHIHLNWILNREHNIPDLFLRHFVHPAYVMDIIFYNNFFREHLQTTAVISIFEFANKQKNYPPEGFI